MRTFFLGLGAQKTGTTWLFNQIINSKRYARGLCKEYHLFDHLHLGHELVRERLAQRIKNFPGGDATLSFDQKVKFMDSFYDDPAQYYNYIDRILDDDGKFTSDISPAYAHLKSDVLHEIREEMERRDIRIKVVFFMREPVSRMESEIRMALRRQKSFGKFNVKDMSDKMTRALANNPLSKSNYSFTVKQLDKVFPPTDIFYCFYEELFLPNNIKRLADFFELPITLFQPNKKVNRSPQPYRYPKEQLQQWAKHFEDEYIFAQIRFNFDIDIWESALYDKLSRRSRFNWLGI